MIIHNKVVKVYDIEVFPNVFSCTLKDSETGQVDVFELSHRKDDILKEAGNMVKLFQDDRYLFCGYNNIHYDNPIMNFIIENINSMPNNYQKVCDRIYRLSQQIITSETSESWKQWKYSTKYATMDLLTMLFSQKLRVGLKEMQVTMQYRNVQEYEGNFDDYLPDEEIDKMLGYNLNDVDSTLELLNRCKKDINLRIGIQEEYGVDVLSKDGMSIGTEILKIKYLEKTKKQWYQIKDLRSPCDNIDLREVIFPFISYETPVLQNLLEEMKRQKVSPGRKGYEKHFLLDNVEVTVGVGGIHTKNEPEAIIPKEDELLLDSDVNSLYPSLIISYSLVPQHLGKEFLEIYGQVREERLDAKRNHQDVKNTTLKLALNGATGNYQNQYSWLYDPVAVMKIRINGQLLLLMLTEMLLKVGARLKQLNTDGILYTIPKNVDYESILKVWEEKTKLTLETEGYEAFYQYAINDYLAIGIGYTEAKNKFLAGKEVLNGKGKPFNSLEEIQKSFIKQKGLFINKVNLGKGMQPMIIPDALNRYFADGTPIEDIIRNCKDLNKFITYQKADKKFSVEYNDQIISRINRYYVSTNGPFLYKCEIIDGKRVNYTNMLKASGVTIVNNLDEIKDFPSNINYKYYIAECKKIMFPFLHVQKGLFDFS